MHLRCSFCCELRNSSSSTGLRTGLDYRRLPVMLPRQYRMHQSKYAPIIEARRWHTQNVDGSSLLPPLEWEGWLLLDIFIISRREIWGYWVEGRLGLWKATTLVHDQTKIVLPRQYRWAGKVLFKTLWDAISLCSNYSFPPKKWINLVGKFVLNASAPPI